MNITLKAAMATFALALMLVGTASAGWSTYIIRNATIGGAPPVIQTNNDYVPGATEFIATAAGQKAGWGTSDLDGHTVGSITRLAIDRLDDRTRFTAGSGPYVAPYINIWITDGAGKYAVIANEPSDPIFQPLYNNGYDLGPGNMADKPVKVYENSDKSWLPNLGVGLTFADVADYQIQAPSAAELTAGWAGLGTGAPRELGTNLAYGVNWVFGDTQGNYISGPQGYVVANPLLVPEPASAVLLLTAAVGGLALVRRSRNADPN